MLHSLRWPLDTVMLLKGDLLQNKYTLKIFIWASAREQWPTPVSMGARQIKDLQQVWLILTEYVASSMKGKGKKWLQGDISKHKREICIFSPQIFFLLSQHKQTSFTLWGT